jgi:aspartate aminotransferase
MLKISQKGRSMPESPIRKLVPFAEGAKKRGLYVHHLNIGQPDIETPEVALNAIHNFGDKVFEYSHSAGIASFREKLTEYYRSVNINVTADEIIVGAGASEALLFAFQSIMDPGDEVIIPEPFYANYNGFAKNGGVNIVPIFSSIETGFALPPIEDFVNNNTAYQGHIGM